jgi:putative ABC transport system permease protein
LNSYTFHISLYDLAFLGAIFIGLTFALLLLFTKTVNRSANRFLALALITLVVWMMRVLAINVGLNSYLLHWDRLPMQFLLALGPLIYFYVLKITRRQYKFSWRDLLHFSPLLLEQGALLFEIRESNMTGAATYDTQAFQLLNPVLQLLVFISMITYLYKCNRLIQGFYRRLQPVLMDRPLVEFRWLRRLLAATALLWCLWIAYAVAGLFVYRGQPGIQVYYPFYIFFAVIMIWTAAAAFLKPQAGSMIQTPTPVKPPIPVELRAKGAWLKKAVEANRYYEDPELSLSLLAEKLQLPSHELSRVINTVFKKSFNDFINEYRVRDVVSRMQDPAFDNMTLLGIAFDAGFNSKSTFNRAFRQITGKTPAEFKITRENKVSSYHLAPSSNSAAVISSHQTTHRWADMKLNREYMFKNYFKTAWRSLVRNKIYSLVNVLGLSLGICACLAIYLITRYEFSFDNFHPDRDRIFCVDVGWNGRGGMNCVPGPMPAAMRREMTGFETVAAFHTYAAGATLPGAKDEKPKLFDDDGSLAIAEPQYFDIFQYRWLSGNAETSLAMPNSVVLTAEKARKYFGDLDPDSVLGKTIYYQDSLMVSVTGVVADWTGNSDFNFKQWISYATIPVSFLKREITLDDWGKIERSSQVMIKLAKDIRPAQIDAQFIALAKRHFGSKLALGARLKPLSGIHFHREYGGRDTRKASLTVLYILIAVAGFILILAIVNFVNLSTAQSMQRAREIGVRKVLGGSRFAIAVQFFTETLLLTVAAVILAALMVKPVLGLFADLVPGQVHFRIDSVTLLFMLLIIAVTTFLAGFYPARVLGNYQPTVTLKGITAVPGGAKGALRRGLIVFQFTISLLFIIASFVIGSQLRYVLHADLGFKTDAIITLNRPLDDRHGKIAFQADRNEQPVTKVMANTAILVEKIRQLVGVDQVIRVWRQPTDWMGIHFGGGRLMGSDEKPVEVSVHYGDEHYVSFYGMKLVAGRNLLPGDSARELLISESYAHALGFADVSKAVGRQVNFIRDEPFTVAGVVADFYETSFHRPNMPVLIKHDPEKETVIAIKIAAKGMSAGEMKTLIGKIEKNWKTIFPGAPFGYSFLDESIAKLYADDLRTELLTNVAMGITVFISCLGLLGLAIFSTEKRTREIGIRKVFGATVSDIIVMLCKEIVFLILIALLIASPLAWYFMHEWLQGFAYRTSLSGWLFVAAGAAAIVIALLTVAFQAIRAALANPVTSLRTE